MSPSVRAHKADEKMRSFVQFPCFFCEFMNMLSAFYSACQNSIIEISMCMHLKVLISFV